jgi:hypothetical protein
LEAVAVLSAHALTQPVVHVVMNGARATSYAMLDVHAQINSVDCRLIALRFDAWNDADNAADE